MINYKFSILFKVLVDFISAGSGSGIRLSNADPDPGVTFLYRSMQIRICNPAAFTTGTGYRYSLQAVGSLKALLSPVRHTDGRQVLCKISLRTWNLSYENL